MAEDVILPISEWPPPPPSSETESETERLQHVESVPCPRLDVEHPRTVNSVGLPENSANNQLVRLQQDAKKSRSWLSSTHKKLRPELQEESLARVGLARWWRLHGKKEVQIGLSFMGEGACSGIPQSYNPNTLLRHIVRTPEARSFMLSEVKRLNKLLNLGADTPEMGSVHAALGSYLEKLRDLEGAAAHLELAIQFKPDEKEFQWLLHRIKRQQDVSCIQQQATARLAQELIHSKEKEMFETGHIPQVERRDAENLSFPEFFFRYALGRRPVVITGLAGKMTTTPWDFDHVRDVAGSCRVTVKHLVEESVEWAQLEDSHSTSVKEFLETLPSQNNLPSEKQTYLFDWSLPINCPALAEELTIPKYFAGDFLQRTSPGSLYQDSWPSLFVAPAGLNGGLHVDAFGSNFWMAMFQGCKRWLFFDRQDVPFLYPSYDHSMDPTFEADLSNPDLAQHPLLKLTHPKECLLQPGEVLFVPAGCPHRVENLEQSLAISGNFVDLSNLEFARQELQVNGLVDQRAAELLGQLESPQTCLKMDSSIEHLKWESFKWRSKDYSKHDY